MAFRVSRSINRVGKKIVQRQISLQTRFYATDHPRFLTNTPEPKVTTLPSGLRVVTAEGIGDVATVGIWVDAGSVHEQEQHNGVANFLQNVVLRGTTKRPKSQLDKEVEALGINLTGCSGRERTAYVSQSLKADIPRAVDILADIVQNTDFKEEQIEKTRSFILKEQNAIQENFELSILDHVHSAAYQGSPYAMSPKGERSTVKNIKNTDLVDFSKKFYTAPNIVLVGTGAVNHDQLVSLATSTLARLPTTKPSPPLGEVDYVGSEIRIRDDTVHSVRAIFAFESVGRADPHYWTFKILKTIFGSWSRNGGTGIYQSSPLAETLSMEKLADGFRSIYTPYNNTGLFGFYTESDEEKIDDCSYNLFNEIQKLSAYIYEGEIHRAKNQLKTNLLAQQENSLTAAYNLATNVQATGRALSVIEQFSRIDAVERSDLKYILDTYLTDVDPVVVSHGPIENLPDYNILRNWTYWNRW